MSVKMEPTLKVLLLSDESLLHAVKINVSVNSIVKALIDCTAHPRIDYLLRRNYIYFLLPVYDKVIKNKIQPLTVRECLIF
jgi:hypothetical protein